jgi:hypothetical protein
VTIAKEATAMTIQHTALLAMVLFIAAPAGAGLTPKPKPTALAVTDANVAERVLSARTQADQLALADYYKAKAAAEDARVAHFDQLFRAYMKMEGKVAEAYQRQARALLKAARMSKQRYELLSQAHRNRAFEDY